MPSPKLGFGCILRYVSRLLVRLWLHLKECFQAFAQQDSLSDNVPFFKARGHCLQLSLQLSQSPLLLESLIKETLYDYSQENPTLKIRWSSHMEKGFPPCWRGISFTWSHVLTAYMMSQRTVWSVIRCTQHACSK